MRFCSRRRSFVTSPSGYSWLMAVTSHPWHSYFHHPFADSSFFSPSDTSLCLFGVDLVLLLVWYLLHYKGGSFPDTVQYSSELQLYHNFNVKNCKWFRIIFTEFIICLPPLIIRNIRIVTNLWFKSCINLFSLYKR